jgi:O-antigen/teichoic acid export membrane protein
MLQGFTLIASVPLGRILGRSDYGALGIVQTTIVTFAVFAGPSIGLTANKYVAELRDTDPVRAARILAMTSSLARIASGLFAMALLGAAEPLATHFLRAPALAPSLRVAALALFLTGIDSAQRGAIAGFEEFRALAYIGLARGLATLPVMLLLAWRFGLLGAVVGLAITAAVEAGINQHVLRGCRRRSGFPKVGRERWTEWRAIVQFSLPALLAGAVSLPAAWLSSAFLTWRPGGYAELGMFNAANNWRNAILFLPVVVNQPFLSILAHSFGVGEYRRFWSVVRMNVLVTTVSAAAVGGIVLLLRGHIMRAYGAGFDAGTPVLVYLVLAATLSAAVSAIGSAVSASGRMWHGAVLNGIWAMTLVTIAWALHGSGATGLAQAWFYAGCVHAVSVTLYVLIVLRRVHLKDAASSSLPGMLV